ncbi:MAG: hypothetical protein HFG69_00315 [Hungatella sp.]|nr:hypothetical protein [Hungatella sp.]
MLWYTHLYMGEKAKRHSYSIIQSIQEKSFRPGVFVITPPSNGNNVLDIYPSYMLLLCDEREKELKILGIAYGYQEALELAGTIVSEMYEETGGFGLEEFLAERGSQV